MTECHIVQDLLPNYTDGLVSADSESDIRQHLQECDSCRALHAKLSAPIGNVAAQTGTREIDFLKKIRQRTTAKITAGIAVLLLIFAALTYFLAIGSPVGGKDLIYSTHVEGGEWRMNLELTNGKSLLVRTEPLYGEENSEGIKPFVGVLVKPYQVLPSPLLEKGNNSFMFGSTTSSFNEVNYRVILRLRDGDVVFTSDNYDKQQS